MSEEWKKEFFEWKDEIEGKFNDLSESKIKSENRLEALEKKYKKWKRHTIQDYFKMSKVLTHVRNNTKQIAEINHRLDTHWDVLDAWEKQIAELRKRLRELIAVYEQETLIDTGLLEKLNSSQESPTNKTEKKEYIASLNDPKAFEGVNLGVLKREREASGGEEDYTETIKKLKEISSHFKNDGKIDEKTEPKCPQCGTLLHECGTNPEKILFLCNKCGHKIKQETEPEKKRFERRLRRGGEYIYDRKHPKRILSLQEACGILNGLEERVRGATRKELIEEIQGDIDGYLKSDYYDAGKAYWSNRKEKYGRGC